MKDDGQRVIGEDFREPLHLCEAQFCSGCGIAFFHFLQVGGGLWRDSIAESLRLRPNPKRWNLQVGLQRIHRAPPLQRLP